MTDTRGPWRAIRLVAVREIVERGLSRAVVISTLITTVVLAAAIGLPNLLSDGDVPRFDVGLVDAGPTTELELAAVGDQLGFEVETTALADRTAAEVAVTSGRVEAVLLVADGVLLVDDGVDAQLRAGLDVVVRQGRLLAALADAGVDAAEAATIFADDRGMEVTSLAPRSSSDRDAGQALAFAGVVLLFISVTSNAGIILTATIEEKTSRVVEVLLGTLRPWHLLAGKLLGVGVIASTQFALFVTVGLGTAHLTSDFALPAGSEATVPLAVVWFLLGFAFYASAYAVAGTLAGSIEDAQSTAGPMGFVLTAGYLLSVVVAVPNPDGLPARILGFLPPFSPMVMPTRIASTSVPAWEVATSIAVMVVATGLVVRLAGRLYEAAILRGGGRLRLREIWTAPT